MTDIFAIQVIDISKNFELKKQTNAGHSSFSTETLNALSHISFNIKQGSAVGVIGNNGSGKSTLLKILSGVSKPSSGLIKIEGKAAGILDVGAGFYPELSGRENVFLYGSLNGFSKADIAQKLDAILSFSEIGNFIDEPVKNYSNGMYLRLAFSIIIHLDFDIYLLDEVLSVGDTAFRNKIKMKIDELKNAGKTLLYVSHNMGEIMQDFNQAMILEKGKLVFFGNNMEAVRKYMEAGLHTLEKNREFIFKSQPIFNYNLLLKSVCVLPKVEVTPNDTIHLEFEFEKNDDEINSFIMGVVLFDTLLHPVFTSIAHAENQGVTTFQQSGNYLLSCTIPSQILAAGIFSVDIYFSNPNLPSQHLQIKRAAKFTVIEDTATGLYRFSLGAVRPNCDWKIAIPSNL